MPRTALVAGLLTAVLGLGACGGEPASSGSDMTNDDSMNTEAAREAKAAKAVTDALFEDQDEDSRITPTQAACVGVDLVDALGVDALVDDGLLTKDLEVREDKETLPEDHAREAAGVMVGCTGEKFFEDAIFDEAPDGVPADVRRCIKDAVDDEMLETMFFHVIVGEEDKGEAVFDDALGACLPQSEA